MEGWHLLYVGGALGCPSFHGIIDELKIYKRALAEEEVKAHYLIGAGSED